MFFIIEEAREIVLEFSKGTVEAFRPWDKSKLLDILGTKHIIYQKKKKFM